MSILSRITGMFSHASEPDIEDDWDDEWEDDWEDDWGDNSRVCYPEDFDPMNGGSLDL